MSKEVTIFFFIEIGRIYRRLTLNETLKSPTFTSTRWRSGKATQLGGLILLPKLP